ncbi:MAG: PH domain-containing protein [Thermoprotei archaeon]
MSSIIAFRPSLRAYALKLTIAALIAGLIIASAIIFRADILSLKSYGKVVFLLLLIIPSIAFLLEVLGPVYFVRTHLYSVGNGKVEESVGAISRKSKVIFISQIREIEVYQGFGGRLFRYGDVRVLSGLGSSEDIFMRSVADPMGIKSKIESFISSNKIEQKEENKNSGQASRRHGFLYPLSLHYDRP